jgi:periplasmic divalent cation tolerance protein
MSTDSIFIYTSVAHDAEATALADRLVGEGLAACVQIVPGIRSVYRWNGEVQHDDELQLVIKASAARFDAIEALLRRVHPYQLPEIVAVPVVRGSAAYLAWIAKASIGLGEGA